jgi:hypothetical protein
VYGLVLGVKLRFLRPLAASVRAGNLMTETPDSNCGAPPCHNPGIDRSRDQGPGAPAEDDEEAWAHSSWDLRQGLDVAELPELPAEWPDTQPL